MTAKGAPLYTVSEGSCAGMEDDPTNVKGEAADAAVSGAGSSSHEGTFCTGVVVAGIVLEDDVVACPFRRPATGTDILVLKRLRTETKKKIFALERRWCALWGVDGCFLAKKRYKKKRGIREEKKTGALVLVNLDPNQYLVMSIVFTTTRKEKKG